MGGCPLFNHEYSSIFKDTQNVIPCLLLKSSAETEQPRDWVWGRMEAVGEGSSQCVRLRTCVCQRVRAAGTAEIQALRNLVLQLC